MMKKLCIILYILFLIVLSSFASADLVDDVNFHYSLNETSGTNAIDSVGVQNGTASNEVWVTGKIANGFNASGVDYIALGTTQGMGLDNQIFSFSGWLKVTDVTANQFALSSGRAWMGVDPLSQCSGNLSGVYNDGVTNYPTCSNVIPSINTWYFLVYTVDGDTDEQRIYINGELVGFSAHTQDVGHVSSRVVTIASDETGGANNLEGIIDEGSFWVNYILSQGNVTLLYNSGSGLAYPFISEDTTPPQINILFPNITANLTYNFNFWINFTTDENTNCSLNENAFIVFSDTGTDFRYNESTLDDGFYAVNISCEDSSSNEAYTVVYFTKDTASPVITSILPLEDNTTSYNNTGTINISFSLSDNIDLFVYNLSIFELDPEVLVFNTSAEISGTSYLFSQLINTTGWNGSYKQTVRTCDSHTKMLVKEAEEIVKEYDTLKFQFDDINVDIKSMGGSEISTDTTKLSDRYTFKFNYDKVTSTKTYELTSSHKITYLPKSIYKGHFVIGDMMWVDFSNAGKVTVEKSGNNYLITVENSGQNVEFNSIGYLNCVEEHYQFELIEVCGNVTCTTYDICQPDVSGGLQDCIVVNETEECFYDGNYSEFQLGCDYCTPTLDINVFCAVWSGTCPVNYTEYCSDINNTCYNETGSETDLYGTVTRGCVGTYGSGDIPEVTIDVIVGTFAVIFSLVGIIALVLIFGWVIKKYKEK